MKDLINKLKNKVSYNPSKIFDCFNVSRDFDISYEDAEKLLHKLFEQGLIEKRYVIVCPECSRPFRVLKDNDIKLYPSECLKCDSEIVISREDVYTGYIKMGAIDIMYGD